MSKTRIDSVQSTNPSDLATKVNEKLEQGWRLHGAIITRQGVSTEFLQFIVLPDHAETAQLLADINCGIRKLGESISGLSD